MNCGEDRDLVGRITSQCKGQRIDLADDKISFLYAWGQGAYHQSGLGDDKPGKATSWQRAEIDIRRKLSTRAIPTGVVRLEPKLRNDYEAMARTFIGQNRKPQEQQGSVGVVLLGRIGDIINFLPILKHINDNYAKPHLVIAREFLPLLDGVSYVEPHPVDLANDQLLPAIKLAERQFKHVIVGQVWGKSWAQPKLTDSYNKESWRQAGFLNRFNDPTMMPVFDRRNLAREAALFAKLDVPGKPMILVKLDGGVSSPCPQCPTLWEPIRAAFGDNFNLVNLSDVRAERIYDLLTLFDRAAALISVDTSLLHLAAASSVPYIALTNPAAWLGTSPRGNCAGRLTYAQALAEPGQVVAAIGKAVQP